jgi:hypothetical protein
MHTQKLYLSKITNKTIFHQLYDDNKTQYESPMNLKKGGGNYVMEVLKFV